MTRLLESKEPPELRSVESPVLSLVALCWGLLAGVLILMRRSGLLAGDAGVATIAAYTLTLGGYIFWTHGRDVISAAGIFSLGNAIFVGFSGLWWSSQAGSLPPGYFFTVALAAVANWLMWITLWRPGSVQFRLPRSVNTDTSNRVLLLGSAVGSVILAYALSRGGPSSTSVAVPVQLALGQFCVVIVALTARPHGALAPIGRIIMISALLLLFATTMFTGYGRLNLVFLGVTAAIVASSGPLGRFVKASLLALVAPALVMLGRLREAYFLQTFGTTGDAPGGGMASVVTPLRDCVRVTMEVLGGRLDVDGLNQIVALGTFWIPRTLWADKPLGTGAELTRHFSPELVGSGHTYVALNQGEWIFMLGTIGFVPMFLSTGYLVRWLDGLIARRHVVFSRSVADVLLYAAVVCAIATLPDLAWGGMYTYLSRVGIRISLICVVAAIFWLLHRRRHDVASSK